MMKKIFNTFLIVLVFGSFIFPNFSFADALVTTEDLTASSVKLKAENLTNNSEVTFEVKNKYSASPSYSETYNTTATNPANNNSTIGSASVSFSNLTQNTSYTGKVYYKGSTQAIGSVDFVTQGDGKNLSIRNVTDTSVTFVFSGYQKNKEISFNVENYDFNTPEYTDPQDVTTDESGTATFQFYGLNPGGHYKYSHSEEPGKFGSFYTVASGANGGTNTSTTTTATGGPNVLVPCSDNCGFNDLFKLIENVINFILFKMAVPIAAIMFAYAGFTMVTSGGSSEKKGAAKKTFLSVAMGLAFVAGAWLIVHTILTIAGYNQSINWFGL